jgi:hypothetical protein
MKIGKGIIDTFLAHSHDSSATVILFLNFKEFDPKWKIFDQCPREAFRKSSNIFQVTEW